MRITSGKPEAAGIITTVLMAIMLTCLTIPTTVYAKSLYVNRDLNANSPISAYDIQADPTYLVWQQTSSPTRYGGVGLAIDTDSEILFVTFEGSGVLDIVNAKNLQLLGRVTAPAARNLAGIVVDQEKQKVYAVDRGTNHLYVYSWDAATKTLTNDITETPFYVPLTGLAGMNAFGIALDEKNDLLYLADVSSEVKVYRTSDWSLTATVHVGAQEAMGIAVDVAKGFLYSGNAYPFYGCTGDIVRTNLSTGEEISLNIRSLTGGISTDCVVGLAVDPATSYLYVTTGNQASGGSDRILVFDEAMAFRHATEAIGNPTGIVVPGKEISYNPLNLSNDDGIPETACVAASQQVIYNVCYDNVANRFDVTNGTLTDRLPAGTTFVSTSGGGAYDAAQHAVTWNLGTVAAGNPGQCFQVVISIPSALAGLTITNSALIDSEETPPTTKNHDTNICVNQPPVADPGGPYKVPEGAAVTVSGELSTDPNDTIVAYEWDLDNDGVYETVGKTATVSYGDNIAMTIGLRVTDTFGATGTATTTVTWTNGSPTIVSLVPSMYVVPVNTTFLVNASFTDPGWLDLHSATCNFGNGGEIHPGVVDQAADTVVASSTWSSHTDYAVPGVYNVTLTVADDDGGEISAVTTVVAYDPSAGFVTGGGWIESLPGAYRPEPTSSGRANFGFISKYHKGASTPSGQTEFNFQTAGMNFHSTSYDWLVVTNNGTNAQFKGTGTINGSGSFRFILWAGDGEPDTFRIRIWQEDANGVETVVYDNGGDDGGPKAISGGSIVIHTRTSK